MKSLQVNATAGTMPTDSHNQQAAEGSKPSQRAGAKLARSDHRRRETAIEPPNPFALVTTPWADGFTDDPHGAVHRECGLYNTDRPMVHALGRPHDSSATASGHASAARPPVMSHGHTDSAVDVEQY